MALVIAALGLLGCAQPRVTVAEWTTLFDGRNLESFARAGTANWRIVDGLAQADAGDGYLISKQAYRDFELQAEVWFDETANSGILIRVQDPANITPWTSYEVNLADKPPKPGFGTAAIVGFASVSPAISAAGRWNTLLIRARGAHLIVELNGVRTAEIHDTKFTSGPFALQRAAGTVKFRKIQVRPL
jgi:hypothetical protein